MINASDFVPCNLCETKPATCWRPCPNQSTGIDVCPDCAKELDDLEDESFDRPEDIPSVRMDWQNHLYCLVNGII